MKCNIDDCLLNTTGSLLAVRGLIPFAAPSLAEKMVDKMFVKAPHTSYEVFGTDGHSIIGLLCMHAGAHHLALGLNKDATSKTKKNALRVNGATLLTMATVTGVYVGRSVARKEVAAASVGLAGLGAACLVQGFKKDKKFAV